MTTNPPSESNSLVTCLECGTTYSYQHAACPNCGEKNPRTAEAGFEVRAESLQRDVSVAFPVITIDSAPPAGSDAKDAGSPQEESTGPSVAADGAPLSALEVQLKKLEAEDQAHAAQGTAAKRAVIVLFGSAAAGKTFFIDRLRALEQDAAKSATGDFARLATKTNQFTAISVHPSDFHRTLTLIDIPGEEFRAATASGRSQVFEQILVSLKYLNGLILYISAKDLTRGDFVPSARTVPGAATEQNYIHMVKAVHLTRRGMNSTDALEAIRAGTDRLPRGRDEKVDIPVFIAVSQCDTLPGWAGTSRPSCEALLREHCPGLLSSIEERFLYFACGILASHVGAPAYTGLEFTRLDDNSRPVPVRHEEGMACVPSDHPFRDFIEEHWRHTSVSTEEGQKSLPSAWIANRTQAAHEADSVRFFEDKRHFLELSSQLRHNDIDLGQVPFVESRCPSFGVRSLLRQIEALYQAREAAKDPDAVYAYTRRRASAAGWTPRSVADRLVRRAVAVPYSVIPRSLALNSPQRNMAVGTLLATVCVVWIAAVYLLAQTVADRDNADLRTRIAVLDYPAGFKVKPSEVWTTSEDDVAALMHSLAAQHSAFGLQDDFLVRPPDLQIDAQVDVKSVPFEALRTPSASARSEAIFKALQCDQLRACQLNTSGLTQTAATGSDARVYSYGLAMLVYQRLTAEHQDPSDAVKQITGHLQDFEDRRARTFGSAVGDNKKTLLPRLATGLMQAHAIFAGSDDTTPENYGRYLADALQAKGTVTKEELRLIGVSQAQLAMHLLGTGLDEGRSVSKQFDAFKARLRLAGMNEGPDTLFSEAALVSDYATLMCVVGQVSRVSAPKTTPLARVSDACSAARPTDQVRLADRQFWQRANLTDAAFWERRSLDKRQQFPLEQYLSVIKRTAASPEFADAGNDRASIAALASFESETALSILLRFGWLMMWVLPLLGFGLGAWLIDRALLWVFGRALFTTPFQSDSPAR